MKEEPPCGAMSLTEDEDGHTAFCLFSLANVHVPKNLISRESIESSIPSSTQRRGDEGLTLLLP